MNRVDRLLQKVNSINRDSGVHFWLNGHCTQCGGACRFMDSDNIVIINDDIPKDYVFIPPDLSVYASVPLVTSPVVSKTNKEQEKVKDTPYSRLFGHR